MIGLGKDIHRLVPGGVLVLGGVRIESELGFDTHSDGDVLCHAIVDALAGALSEGDLGTWFPEDDLSTRDAKSLGFVQQMMSVVRSRGLELRHIDSFVVLGTTRLRSHVDQMRRNLSIALEVPIDRVSVKARSNDGLGLEGEGKACSAEAVVLLSQRDVESPDRGSL